ncbi:ZP domain-containing protein [Patella vulgata]|uniref:ZP domain-containing protein n=1 Tax=Patella vulgata TaxID=6465 RepID=UPI0021800DF5|nr:ZP domain-containing protein [Patella vulgata]XP_050396304.1 ZP domain-containing protein [Patella vulgata]
MSNHFLVYYRLPSRCTYRHQHQFRMYCCIVFVFNILDTIEPVTNESLQSRNDIVCSKKSIQLLIPKTYLHSTEWKLNDPGCRTRFNGTHILKEFGLNECGTTVEFSNHSLIFRNELRDAYGSSADGTISIECNYPETQNLSNYDFPVRDRVVLYEKNKGLLGVIRMNQYRKDDFTEVVSEYPAEIQPDGSINIQLVIEENQSKIGVRAENCIATTTRSPANNENTKLYENGCESRVVRVRKTRSNEIKFSFKLSAIPQNQSTIVSTVYVHCEVAACSFHECDATCNNRRRKRSSHQSYVITTGPIMFTTLKRESEGSSLIAIACLSLSALAVIIALMALISRKVQA